MNYDEIVYAKITHILAPRILCSWRFVPCSQITLKHLKVSNKPSDDGLLYYLAKEQ
jgi:hypothetical protein